jgi:hypothetical protein
MKNKLNTITILMFSVLGCTFNSKENTQDKTHLDSKNHKSCEVIPRVKLDHDTINLGDSLVGIIGMNLKRGLTNHQKNELFESLRYHVDTTSNPNSGYDHHDSLFIQKSKINDSTFRFSFIPNSSKPKYIGISKKEFIASIKVSLSTDSSSSPNTCVYTNKFSYFIKSNASNSTR